MMLDAEDLAKLTDEDFTQLGGLNQIRCAPSQHRAMEKLHANYPILCQHLENVAANPKHDRQSECKGVLAFLTSLKFVKMLMFLLDLHEIMKVLSLHFQREKMLLIDVLPLLQTALLDLENLRGGRGTKMLQFTRDFNARGTYKGVKLHQVGYKTRGKSQSRLDQYVESKEDLPENEILFRSFNIYIDFVRDSLHTRFAPLRTEPISGFSVFVWCIPSCQLCSLKRLLRSESW